jgi:beta-lactamase class A
MGLSQQEQKFLAYKKKYKFLFFAAFLLGILVVWFFLTNLKKGSLQHSFEEKLNRYSLLDPTRNLLEQKDAITNIQPLREYLDTLAVREASSTKISIYFEFLNTGANISVNKDEKVWPVSLAKLPLAMLAMKKVEEGHWKETDMLEVLDENVNSGSDSLYKEGSNVRFEVWKLITEMLINSDNTAYRIIKRNTSLEEREAMAEEVGLGELFEDQGKVSAKEYSRLFRVLYTASYLNQENSQKLLKLLSQNHFVEFLNLGMPKEVMFSHKQGENTKLNVYSDSGIVYFDSRPYILSVMLEPSAYKDKAGKEYAKGIMQEISKKTFEYIKNK